MMIRNKALDGFRGLGCLLVLLGHTQYQGRSILPGAVISMDLFFTLSGFLISGLLLTEYKATSHIQFLTFWKRRAARLLPAFYVYFFIGTSVYLITKYKPIVGDDALVSILSTGLYYSNWSVASGYWLGIFTVTWSLSLEEQFYLVCPPLLLLGLKKLSPVKIISVIACLILFVNIYRAILFNNMLNEVGLRLAWSRCFYAFDTRTDSLLIGVLAGFIYHFYSDRFKIHDYLLSFSACLYFLTLFIRDLPIAFHEQKNSLFTQFLMTGGFSFYSILGVIVILGVLKLEKHWITLLLSNHHLVKIGAMSYSIYIWHTTVFGGLDVILAPLEKNPLLWVIKILIRFPSALLVGYLSFRFVEKPALRFLNKESFFTPLGKK